MKKNLNNDIVHAVYVNTIFTIYDETSCCHQHSISYNFFFSNDCPKIIL